MAQKPSPARRTTATARRQRNIQRTIDSKARGTTEPKAGAVQAGARPYSESLSDRSASTALGMFRSRG